MKGQFSIINFMEREFCLSNTRFAPTNTFTKAVGKMELGMVLAIIFTLTALSTKGIGKTI